MTPVEAPDTVVKNGQETTIVYGTDADQRLC